MMRMRIATLRMVKGSRGEAMIDCSSPIQCNGDQQENDDEDGSDCDGKT